MVQGNEMLIGKAPPIPPLNMLALQAGMAVWVSPQVIFVSLGQVLPAAELVSKLERLNNSEWVRAGYYKVKFSAEEHIIRGTPFHGVPFPLAEADRRHRVTKPHPMATG